MSGPPIGWVSTRNPGGSAVGFAEAMLRGLAPDGGLYVPDRIPANAGGAVASFADHAVDLLTPWLQGDLDRGAVEVAVRAALDFPVPVVEVGDGVFLVELFHGPTLSFKDFGARTMARLLKLIPGPAQGERTIFVATSGDTGSAVADGFAGIAGMRVVLLYPDGQVSPVQERQLAAPRAGVLALRVRGSFDQCQRLVKEVFSDERFRPWRPTSANSINVGRLLPQLTYHSWAASQIPEAVLVVPSGNLGNLTAAVLARRSGVRFRGLVAAHNANHAFPDFLGGGPPPDSPSVRTLSNAMDVGSPSNFERLHALLGRDMLRATVRGASVSDDETNRSMARVYRDTGYLCDPHTAVGMEVVRRLQEEGVPGPFLVMATAHPSKFPATVRTATGAEPQRPPAIADLPDMPDEVLEVPATLDALHAALESQQR